MSNGKEDHGCLFCNFKCAINSQLELHMRRHTQEKPFVCDQCKHGFAHPSNLRFHMLSVHQGIKRVQKKNHKCPLCPFATIVKCRLEAHTRRHKGKPGFPCQHGNCDYAGTSARDIRKHSHQKHKTVHVCSFPNCSFRGKTKWAVRRHALSHSDYRPFSCGFDGCSYRAKRSDTLQNHRSEVHHSGYKPFACSKCNYRTSTKKLLSAHDTTHALDDSVKCTFSGCSYSCKSKSSLYCHNVSFHKEKTFKCDFGGCSASAASRSNLEKHKKAAHYDKVHKCQSCDYQAVYPSALQRHIATHTKRQKIPCPTKGCTFLAMHQSSLRRHLQSHKANLACPVEGCGYAGASDSSIKRHMKVHNPSGRPFHCPFCPKHFASSQQHSIHVQFHTKEKPLKCPLCNFGAITSSNITAHVRAIHSRVWPQFVFNKESICDHCNVHFGCDVGLAIHKMKLKTAVVSLTRLELVQK